MSGRIPLRPALAGLALLALLGACASTAPAAEKSPATDEKAAEKTDDTEKQHKIELAELELKKAKIENEKGVGAARVALEVAERKLAAAQAKLQVFQATTMAVRVDEAQLDLDRSTGRAADAQAELDELEAMYAEEEFAEMTKELVLSRGRRNLEHARRSVAIGETKLARLVDAELPAEEAALARSVLEAEGALASARLALQIAEIGGQVSVTKATRALEKAKKGDEQDED